MRYLSIFNAVERESPPSPEEVQVMGELIEEMSKAGKLLTTEGCLPSARGARVRRSGEDTTVTDGPFTGAKEVVGGFAILQADSKEEAVELAKRFLDVVGDGVCEIRELYEQPAFVAE
ncbi:MAG: YciI family protein [Actinomycetota bacterium]|nr:YciI family protein [Actinomycetota bacterium]